MFLLVMQYEYLISNFNDVEIYCFITPIVMIHP